MKQVATILLALHIFLQPFCGTWTIISFKINQAEIAQTLCVMKAKKNNSCQGACYLKKKLAEAEQEQERQAPANLKEKLSMLDGLLSKPYELQAQTTACTDDTTTAYEHIFYPSSFVTDLLRPPQFI